MTFELDHDAFPDGFDSEALERGLEAMREIVPTMEGVVITITHEFEKAVRDALADHEHPGDYAQDRGDLGIVMGRVVPQENGQIAVIFDSRILVAGQEQGVPEETFKHEAYHVALRQRGECLDLDQREGVGGVPGSYLRAAEIACEEFRVELPLCRESPSGHYDSFPRFLQAVDHQIRRLSREYQDTAEEPDAVAKISRGIGEQFGSLVTAVAYVAATMEATGWGLPTIDPKIRRRVLGSEGPLVIERLRDLPGADQAADLSEIEAVAQDVAKMLEQWIVDIGFRWEEISGDLHFKVLKPVKWLLISPG